MNSKKIIFLLVLIILSVFISSAVSAQDLNATDEVKISDNNQLKINEENALSATHKVSGNTFEDIQKVVDNAKSGDTISLSGKYIGKGSKIKISKELKIEGNGATLDGDSSSMIFEITGNHVTVNNITFVNGKSASSGAIDWWSGTKNGPKDSYGLLTNCRFIDCNADYYAGAVYFFDNELTMRNCYFENNRASKGGAVYVLGSNCVIEDCEFQSNFAKTGGAIFSEQNTIITGCNFQTNTANNGGAIYSEGSNATISKSKFSKNDASEGKNLYVENVANVAVDTCEWNVANPHDYTTLGIKGSINAIELKATSITVPESSGLVKAEQTITATVKDSSNNLVTSGRVEFTVNGKIYSAAVRNGKANIKYTLTSVGNFPSSAKYIGNGFYDSSASIAFNVISKPNNVKFSAKSLTTYYNSGAKLSISAMDIDSKPAANVKVSINLNRKTYTATSNANGIATFTLPKLGVGSYKAVISSAEPSKVIANSISASIKINRITAKLTPAKLSTTYGSGKYFQIKAINSNTKKALANIKLSLKIYTDKSYRTVTVTTASNGYAKYAASTLSIGTHKIVVSTKDKKYITAASKTSSVKISPATLLISAPKVTNEYQKSQTFKVVVKNKQTGKAMTGVSVSIKVYSKSSSKIYNVKTNSKGTASINTKSLSKASHSVVISVKKTGKYKAASAKSSITITKVKLQTTITIDRCYKTGNLAEYYIELTLRDSKGNPIADKEIDIETIIYMGPHTTSKHSTAKTNSAGIAKGYVNAMIGGIANYDVTARFAGDNSYLQSESRTVYLD